MATAIQSNKYSRVAEVRKSLIQIVKTISNNWYFTKKFIKLNLYIYWLASEATNVKTMQNFNLFIYCIKNIKQRKWEIWW